MKISNPEDLKRIERACNSASMHHLDLAQAAEMAIDPVAPEKELVDTLRYHHTELDRYLNLSTAARINLEQISVHEKAKS